MRQEARSSMTKIKIINVRKIKMRKNVFDIYGLVIVDRVLLIH